MGVVILANERVLDRPVAIKVLRRHAADQHEMRERFRRDAPVAARLTHPNIVPLHTFGDVDGELFFVMGFIEGETLAARLKRVGRIESDDALRILREVSDALGCPTGSSQSSRAGRRQAGRLSRSGAGRLRTRMEKSLRLPAAGDWLHEKGGSASRRAGRSLAVRGDHELPAISGQAACMERRMAAESARSRSAS